MIAIAFVNQKGGVAKTTSALNIAAAIAMQNEDKKVAVLDLDPQCSSTIGLGFEPSDFPVSIKDVLDKEKDITASLYKTSLLDNLFIIPSSHSLSATEAKMTMTKNSYLSLRDVLNRISEYCDYVIIDSPPQLSLLTMAAIAASDYYVVPCSAEYYAYRGLKLITSTAYDIEKLADRKITSLGVIATMYNARIKAEREIYEALEKNHEIIGVTKRTTKVNSGIYEGKPVVVKEPKTPIAQEYMRIAEEIIKKVEI